MTQPSGSTLGCQPQPLQRRDDGRRISSQGPGRGPEESGKKKFSLWPEKFTDKGYFEGWVNQFEEYATIGQWSNDEPVSLLFLSLIGSARVYFVGLLE